MIWRDPWKYGYNEGHQLVQSLIAIANGGFFGVGLGNGYPGYIPVVESDFIFAAICEELGLLSGFAVLILNSINYWWCNWGYSSYRNNFTFC